MLGLSICKGGNVIKAITLLEPWAILVATGFKKIETRSRISNYRGKLAIHASKRNPKWARELCFLEPFRSVLDEINMRANYTLPLSNLPLGAVIATCWMKECCLIKEDGLYRLIPYRMGKPEYYAPLPGEPERSFGDFTPGRYAFILEDVKPLPEPIPAKGILGMWNWEPPEGVIL